MKINLKTTKKDRIIQLSIVVIGVIIASIILIILFNKEKTSINQGAFKINDIVISNTIDITDMLLGNKIDESKLEYNLSTNSNIYISIAKLSNSLDIKSAYINNFKFKLGYSFNIYTNIEKMELINKNTKFDIKLDKKENTYETNFNIACIDIEKGLKLKEDIKATTLLQLLETSIYEDNDKIGYVNFDLNIIDTKNNTYKASLKYKVDLTNFLIKNYYIDKVNTTNYNFIKL